MLIVLEGVDGAGKGTQLAKLRDALVARGRPVHVTAEPSALSIGALLRRYLRGELVDDLPGPAAMALLFAADRMQHLQHEIEPHLAAGDVVLCDRYVASSIAYQSASVGGGAADEQAEWMRWIARINGRARVPDRTIVLDLDPAIAATRRARRGTETELFERLELQRRVQQAYRALAANGLAGPIDFVDATPPVEEVHHAILDLVLP
ncbi:MAG: dTMP kinase [Polyangiales bacterium]